MFDLCFVTKDNKTEKTEGDVGACRITPAGKI